MVKEVEIKTPDFKEGIDEEDVERKLGYPLPKLSDDELKDITEYIKKIFREKFELANKSIPKNIVEDIIKIIKEKYGFPFYPEPNRCPESPYPYHTLETEFARIRPYKALPPEYYDIIIENIVNSLILKFQPPPSEEEISDRFARLAANDSYVFKNGKDVMNHEQVSDLLKHYEHYLNEHLPLLSPIQQQFKQPLKLDQCDEHCLKKKTV